MQALGPLPPPRFPNLATPGRRPTIFRRTLTQFGDSPEQIPDPVTGPVRAAREAAEAAGGKIADAAETAGDRIAEAAGEASERISDAAGVAGEKFSEATEAAREVASEAGEKIADAIAAAKPSLRGVSHTWAFFAFLIAGVTLLVFAAPGEPRLAIGIYVLGLLGLFGVSTVYHRVDWKRPSARQWMRRLDHTMILVFIAATYTPFALLVLEGRSAMVVLIVLWAIALAGVLFNLVWINAPKVLRVVIYISVGVAAAIPFPEMASSLGVGGTTLLLAGGVLYLIGAIIYAAKRPNPRPGVFGYHEVFHLLVIAAAILQFAAIAGFVVPGA